MIFRTPTYYPHFTCIAGKCSDNCCIGWEIDIDHQTADRYRQVDGPFGERLRNSIRSGDPCSFILDRQERCPFLNGNNLCDIILQLGASALCQICSDHPRYYEWFGDSKEGGIGLCCEAAARIILTHPFAVMETEIPHEDSDPCDTLLLSCLMKARSQIIAMLQEMSLTRGIHAMLDFAQHLQDGTDNGDLTIPKTSPHIPAMQPDLQEILAFLQTLEPIDARWHPLLCSVSKQLPQILEAQERFLTENPKITNYLRNIAIYFIWRYFCKGIFDGEFLSRAKLAAISTAVIGCLFADAWLESGTLTEADCVRIAKNYSKEIEYSEENLNAVLDGTYELDAMTAGRLKGLFAKGENSL